MADDEFLKKILFFIEGELNSMRILFAWTSTLILLAVIGLSFLQFEFIWLLLILVPIILLGYWDMTQKRHSILRNFPVIGHFRYIFEMIRPEISQYFIETNTSGRPFSREQRSIVYQRAKLALQTLPFGTQHDVYEEGYEWVAHSMRPTHVDPQHLRVMIGESQCKKPYFASLLNISAMSFGALSTRAVLALNGGAKMGGFAHNTGEGGLSSYHLKPGGDIIWQIGTGYFGCRTKDGKFSLEHFQERAQLPEVKMIEIKLSQGAKPGHGGILPAKKITPEIAEIRGVEMGKDVLSPPAHTAFSTPIELVEFLAKLRDASGGKPIGLKFCVGLRHEFFALCKAMIKTGVHPDYIAVDGAEGGTGAAPLEFSNSIGMPLKEGLVFVHNVLSGFGLRGKVKVIASGKIVTGFDIIHKLALGADLCYSARAMMFALGCIQALRCNSNECPAGVATQNIALVKGLDVEDKTVRVANFHKETIKSVAELLGAMGLERTEQVGPWHVMQRTSKSKVENLYELYNFVAVESFLKNNVSEQYARWFQASSPETFAFQVR